jgi:hypothetical protein
VDAQSADSVEDLFGLYRTEVEEIAADQYDHAFKNPIVRGARLGSPPPLPIQ